MAKDIEAARYLVWRAGWEMDQGRRNTKFAAMAKAFAADMAMKVATDAVQVFGGYGYSKEYPVEKLIALKDIMKSNALIESVNKLIKYDYLFPKKLQNQIQLTNYLKSFVIPDYNNKRPHGSLGGLTPLEAYKQKKVNFAKIRANMVTAHKMRICYNQTHQCLGCPFDCKNKHHEKSKEP
jgi:hypothetical protein